jgi:hypothetical protein
MKRKVDTIERAAEETQRNVAQLANLVQVQQMRMTSVAENAAIAAATQTVNVWGTAESASLAQLRSGTEPPVGGARQNHFELTGRLALGWERLRGMLGLSSQLTVGVNLSKDPYLIDLSNRRRSFVADYLPQLTTLRDLRNAAVHSETVPPNDLREGAALLADITRRAEEWLPDADPEG